MREKYVEALCREIEHEGGCSQWSLDKRSAGTVYIGGGTPSVLTIRQLGKIIDTIRKHFPLSAPQEFTIEVNPDDVTPEYASGLKKLPVNRISMGVQSFHDSALKWMNRRHTADKAREAFNTLRCCGFENISLDLIFGYASLSEQMWKEDLEQICTLAPEHVSAYQMSIEPGSATAAMAHRGEKVIHSPQKCALQYSMLQNILKEKGYFQYEISNFALPGFYSRHNSSYWQDIPYLGCGASAHSYDGNNRKYNKPNLSLYLEGINTWHQYGTPNVSFFETEHLSKCEKYNDRIITSLRTCWGLNLKKLEKDFGKDFLNYCLQMATPHFKNKTLQIIPNQTDHSQSILKLTQKGIFLSDGIMSDLLYIDEQI